VRIIFYVGEDVNGKGQRVENRESRVVKPAEECIVFLGLGKEMSFFADSVLIIGRGFPKGAMRFGGRASAGDD
jgi:hypothetical protein